MVSREDLESFLIRMDLDYEEVDEGMFLTRTENSGTPVVVHYTDALLLIRMKVMDMPDDNESSKELYRTLLELNARAAPACSSSDSMGPTGTSSTP